MGSMMPVIAERTFPQYPVAFATGSEIIECRPRLCWNLGSEIVQWHEQPRSEAIRLLLDLAICGVPSHNVLLAALYTIRMF